MVTGGVILSAGASRRMGGRPKALLTVGGTSFLALITDTFFAAGVEQVRAVVSADLLPRAAALAVAGLELVVPPEPTPEPLLSLKAAMAGVSDQWDAMLIHPVDHPLVRPGTIRRQIGLLEEDPAHPIVRLCRRGQGGHPLLVGQSCFGEILDLPAGGVGLRGLLKADPDRVRSLETDDLGACAGVNTEDDYRRLLSLKEPARPISPPSR